MVGLILYNVLLSYFSDMEYLTCCLFFALFLDMFWAFAVWGIWHSAYNSYSYYYNTDTMIEGLRFKTFKTYFPKLTDFGLIIWYIVYIGSSICFTLFLLLIKLFKFIFIKQEPERTSVFNEDYKYKNFNNNIEDCKD